MPSGSQIASGELREKLCSYSVQRILNGKRATAAHIPGLAVDTMSN